MVYIKLTETEKEKRKQQKKQQQYKNTHKIINEVEYKLCNKHHIYFPDESAWLPLTNDNFYKNNKNSIDGFYPYCKECCKKKSYKWIKDNPEKFKKNYKKYMKTDSWKQYKKENNRKTKYIMQKWRKDHPDLCKKYSENWRENKEHNINKEELEILYEYCNYSCMYCGMSEEKAIEKYNKKLFKDHFINDGDNTIDNCILCCNGCSSSKRDKDFFEWYNIKNPVYSVNRMNKIIAWINMFKIKNK
jgi:hypothetical protein